MERGTGLPLLPLETNVMGDIVYPRRYADASGTGTRNVTRTLEGHTGIGARAGQYPPSTWQAPESPGRWSFGHACEGFILIRPTNQWMGRLSQEEGGLKERKPVEFKHSLLSALCLQLQCYQLPLNSYWASPP